jgi:hypothetical protein
MKRYKVIIWILVIINIGLISFMFFQHRTHQRPRIAKILNIDDTRASEINRMEIIHFKEKKKLIDKSKKLRAKLLFSFENETSESQADSILHLISDNQYELDKMTYLFFKDIKSKCSVKEREKLNKRHAKRSSGIGRAVDKLTKEEQNFVDSLNNEIFEKADPYDIAGMIKKAKAKNDPNHPAMKHVAAIEDIKKHGGALSVQGDHVRSLIKALGEDANVGQIDEISKGAALKYLAANKKDDTKAKETGDYDRMTKRMRGTDMAVRKYTAKPGSKYVRVPATEEVEIVEARGRPKKAGAKDFTIHPKTKEKLMHNNPADMKRIERLQKNGVLEKPKVEAGQHIMNQLQKAKTSMLGGSKINFTHGDSKEVSGTHAAKILSKYAGMKPTEKEAFQKFVGHSHENLMKHV